MKKGCFACHSISAFDIKSASDIGPDLSFAVSDVQNRFGKTLEDFLAKPTGTMAVVLSTQIQLTDDERREAIEKLKSAYQKKMDQQAQAANDGRIHLASGVSFPVSEQFNNFMDRWVQEGQATREEFSDSILYTIHEAQP